MRIISPAELSPLKGITFTNVWRLQLERLGKFPKRIKLGVRRYGYLESELDQRLEERAAGREPSSLKLQLVEAARMVTDMNSRSRVFSNEA
jgi:predicted DNA-binding transcriptional regulator AlpA